MRIVQSKIISNADIVDDTILNAKINSAAGIVSTKLDLTAIAQVITPDATGTRNIGTSAKAFQTIYFNDIQGSARGQVLAAALISGS